MWDGLVRFFLSLQEDLAKSSFAGILLFDLSKGFPGYGLYHTSLILLNIYLTKDSKKWWESVGLIMDISQN